MNNRLRSVPGWEDPARLQATRLSPDRQLRHLRKVTSSLIQEALKVWADLWAEMEGRVVSGVMVLPEAKEGFEPQCGWPEFLERMWLLRFYLDSARRFSEQQPSQPE